MDYIANQQNLETVLNYSYLILTVIISTTVILAAIVTFLWRVFKFKISLQKTKDDLGAAFKRIDELDEKITNTKEYSNKEIKDVKEQMKSGFNEMKLANSLIIEGLKVLIDANQEVACNKAVANYREKLADKTYTSVKG